jgi:glycosyltransferase involved in cell wall biosynthesis
MLRILWRPDYNETGNAYGYTTHMKNTRRGLERRDDVVLTKEPKEADIAVDINTPENWEPVSGLPNVLFTMYEATTLPKQWVEPLQKPELVVTPTRFNKQLIGRYRSGPIRECWEGMWPDKFTFYQREFPTDRPFIFLWVGASNPRKGYQHMGYAWEYLGEHYPEVHKNSALVMKTTQPGNEERVINYGNLRIDTHDYSLDKLVALYKWAHAFVFPSMGEGWGLTMHEAAATGLPCIYTDWSAPHDWFSSKYGYPVKHQMMPITVNKPGPDGTQQFYHKTEAASPKIDEIAKKMARVYHNYDEALHKGRIASEYVRGITWDTSAARLVEILNEYLAEKQEAA